MAQHSRWTGARASNNTILVVDCDGPPDPERLRRALDRFLDVCPWPASRLRRPFPWGRLHWAAGRRAWLKSPPIHRRVAATNAELQRLLEAELNDAIDPRRDAPLRFVVIETAADQGTPRGALVMTWFHPLMDPRGGQNLLVHLDDADAGAGRGSLRYTADACVASAVRRPLRERARLARRSLEYMRTLAPVPPVCPGTGITAPGPVRFCQQACVQREAAVRPERATREISWRLAIVGQAMADLWRRRGLPDVPFLLPISVDLRPTGEAGPTFGNQLAFHFARFRPSETTDVPALASALRRQIADAVRDGQIEANAEAMEFLQYRPLVKLLRALPWTSDGAAFSFNCADIADFPPGLDRFLGRRVDNAYHAPCVLPQPGIGVFFNRCAGQQNLVVSWVEGAVAGEEARRILDTVREGMGWIARS